MVMFIIANGILFSFVLTSERIPNEITQALVGLDLQPWSFLLLVTIVLLIAGCFMETSSAILIIVRALTDEEIKILARAATAAGLDALFEIHNEPDLARALAHQATIIGVNNRDLAVFKTDLSLSERLIPQFPQTITAISESGIFTAADAARVRQAGAHALLVGEALMKAPDPAQLIADFRRS